MSINMVFLPWNLIDTYCLQELHDILTSVIVWLAISILTHQYDRHIWEIWSDSAAELSCAYSIGRNAFTYREDSECYSLFYDHSAM